MICPEAGEEVVGCCQELSKAGCWSPRREERKGEVLPKEPDERWMSERRGEGLQRPDYHCMPERRGE